MTEHELFTAALYACAAFFIIERSYYFLKKHTESSRRLTQNKRNVNSVKTPEELDARRNELHIFTATFLRINPDRLQLKSQFERDLKVSPVELLNLLDEIEDRFDITVGRRNIVTIGDLLDLIQLQLDSHAEEKSPAGT